MIVVIWLAFGFYSVQPSEQAATQLEDVGRELRSHMDWIETSF